MTSCIPVLLLLVTLGVLAPSASAAPVKRACRPSHSADHHLDRLPGELLEQIVDRVADPASVVNLARTGRGLHDAVGPHLAFRGLLHHRVRGRELADLAARILSDWKSAQNVAAPNIAQHATFSDALGLYDRLLECTALKEPMKIKLVSVLLKIIAVFCDVIGGLDFRRCSVMSLQVLRTSWPRTTSVTWHPHIVQGARRVTELLENRPLPRRITSDLVAHVRGMATDPFQSAFPNNTDFADYLLQYLCDRSSPHFGQTNLQQVSAFQKTNAALLIDSTVLQNLVRHGVRFEFWQYLEIVNPPAEKIQQLYPLLRKAKMSTRTAVNDGLLKPLKRFVFERYDDMSVALIQIPEIRDLLLQHMDLFAELLRCAIRYRYRHRLVQFICEQRYAADLLNARPATNFRPLHAAFARPKALPLILQVPGVDLGARCPKSGKSTVSYLFDLRTGLDHLFRVVPADLIAKVIRADPAQFFLTWEATTNRNRHWWLSRLPDLPFMTEFINVQYGDDRRTFLHWAARQAEFRWIETLLLMGNVDVTIEDAHGHLAFHYVNPALLTSHQLRLLVSPNFAHCIRFLSVLVHGNDKHKLLFLAKILRANPETIRARSARDGATLLHLAFRRNELGVAALLLTAMTVADLGIADHYGHVPFAYFTPDRQSLTAFAQRFPAETITALIGSDSARFVCNLMRQIDSDPGVFYFVLEQAFIGDILFVKDHCTQRTLYQYAIACGYDDIAHRLLQLAESYLLQ